jgi:periplasmic protein TonB
MQRPSHAMGTAAGPRMTTERMAGIGFVVLLHVVAIWALVAGMVPGVAPKIVKDITLVLQPTVDHPPPPAPTPPTIPHPEEPTMQPPIVPLAGDPDHSIVVRTGPTQPPVPPTPLSPTAPDTSAVAVAATHTTPDYPPLARKLGEQGHVLLRLGIAADGAVTGATVERSSGFADLDQTAVDWVIAHWRYKPATQGGTAVAGTARAEVVFSLRNAR